MLRDMLPGTDNVVRFPVELRERPSMEMLRQLRPDVRVVLLHAEAFGFERPADDLRERTDMATAEYIGEHAGADGRVSEQFLYDLLRPVMTRAIELARLANDVAAVSEVAEKAAEAADATEHARDRARELAVQCVRLQIEAHLHAETAEGVARAVQYARRGERWVPRDHEADMNFLLAAEDARRSRG